MLSALRRRQLAEIAALLVDTGNLGSQSLRDQFAALIMEKLELAYRLGRETDNDNPVAK